MSIRIMAVVLALLMLAGVTYAADSAKKVSLGNFGKETVNTVTDTTKSAVTGTADVVKTSVEDTAATPTKAIQATKDTANKAFEGADAAIKSVTGE